VNGINETAQHIRVGRRENAVTEIEDMSRTIRRPAQHVTHTLLNHIPRGEQQGWIEAEWKISETNRRAKYYSLTRAGRKALTEEAVHWERLSGAISAIVRAV